MKNINKLYLTLIMILIIPIVIIFSSYFNSQNIYEEIYTRERQSLENTGGKGPTALSAIEAINMSTKEEAFDKSIPVLEEYSLKKLPTGSDHLGIAFLFKYKFMEISFSRNLSKKVSIVFDNTYHLDKNTLTKKFYIVDTTISDTDTITDKNKIKTYLSEYKLNRTDLEKYYNQYMNDIFLKDWQRNTGSRFSPKNLGKIKIIEKW